MAIELSIYNQYSGNNENAYCVIDNMVIDNIKGIILATVDCYTSQGTRNVSRTLESTKPFYSQDVHFTLDAFKEKIDLNDTKPLAAAAYKCLKVPRPYTNANGDIAESNHWATGKDI
jgi:hypothetical protein